MKRKESRTWKYHRAWREPRPPFGLEDLPCRLPAGLADDGTFYPAVCPVDLERLTYWNS